jgi:hypothetical protein
MSSRSVRRRQHKTVQRLATLAEQQRQAEAQALLVGWQREARRRAHRLTAPEVWQLAHNPNIQAQAAAIDPSGELQRTLEVICADAIANVVDRRMACRSRPVGGNLRPE